MPERRMFEKDYIEKELQRVGLALKSKISVFLIGGSTMVFGDLKPATKDVDIVFTSPDELREFLEALKSLDYREVVDLPEEYKKLGASAVLGNLDGFQFDLFHKQVYRGLVISDGMKSRAELFKTFGKLDVYLMCPEDIFLFKGITDREADLDDMRVLTGVGLDWDVIKKECILQEKRRIWEYFLVYRLEELKSRFGIEAPIIKELWRRGDDELIKKTFTDIVKDGNETFDEIHGVIKEKYNYSGTWTRRRLKELVEKGVLKVNKDKRKFRYFL